LKVNNTIESLKPVNLLRSTLRKVSESAEIKEEMINMAAGIGVGMITKKIIGKNTSSAVRNVIATLVELGIIGGVAKNADTLKSLGNFLLSKVMAKFTKRKDEDETENH